MYVCVFFNIKHVILKNKNAQYKKYTQCWC